MKRTYVAVTTTNAQTNGWHEVARGSDKAAVQAQAEQTIGPVATDYGTDIYCQTEHTNLRVVSKSEAKRTFGVDIDKTQYDW